MSVLRTVGDVQSDHLLVVFKVQNIHRFHNRCYSTSFQLLIYYYLCDKGQLANDTRKSSKQHQLTGAVLPRPHETVNLFLSRGANCWQNQSTQRGTTTRVGCSIGSYAINMVLKPTTSSVNTTFNPSWQTRQSDSRTTCSYQLLTCRWQCSKIGNSLFGELSREHFIIDFCMPNNFEIERQERKLWWYTNVSIIIWQTLITSNFLIQERWRWVIPCKVKSLEPQFEVNMNIFSWSKKTLWCCSTAQLSDNWLSNETL